MPFPKMVLLPLFLEVVCGGGITHPLLALNRSHSTSQTPTLAPRPPSLPSYPKSAEFLSAPSQESESNPAYDFEVIRRKCENQFTHQAFESENLVCTKGKKTWQAFASNPADDVLVEDPKGMFSFHCKLKVRCNVEYEEDKAQFAPVRQKCDHMKGRSQVDCGQVIPTIHYIESKFKLEFSADAFNRIAFQFYDDRIGRKKKYDAQVNYLALIAGEPTKFGDAPTNYFFRNMCVNQMPLQTKADMERRCKRHTNNYPKSYKLIGVCCVPNE